MLVHIITSAATMGYHDYCVNNHRNLADNPADIEFLSHCMDDASFNAVVASGGRAVKTPGGSGSIGHAKAIQSVLDNLAPGVINVNTDSDCIVLVKGWDTKTKEFLSEYGIIGTVYEDIGGFSSGDAQGQTYKRIPNFTWVALSPAYDWKFDAMCDKANPLPIDTEELSATFNLPIGRTLFREPIWRLPVYIRENGVKYYSFDFVRPTLGNAKAVKTNEDYHTEYQTKDGTPFVAHQRGSMSKAFRQHHLSTTFYDACEDYLRSL